MTIPASIRNALGLKPRDRVIFEIDAETGAVTLRRLQSVSDLYGAVSPRARPEDFARRREEFEQGVADEVSAET